MIYKHRRGSSAILSSANPVPEDGEIIVESDTSKIKLGNGIQSWNELSYLTVGEPGPTGPQGSMGAQGPEGISVPIAGVCAWFKNLYSTLPTNFVECNGQTLSDGESPLNGMTIPNLNDGYFVRGSATAGTVQDDATAINGISASANGSHNHLEGVYTDSLVPTVYSSIAKGVTTPYSTRGGSSVQTRQNYVSTAAAHTHSLTGGDTETRPKNISAVWVMRVK